MAYTTINKSTDYFNTKLYTGNGTTDTAITGVGFQPDLSIIKARDMAYDHNVMDAVRGSTKRVATNLTDAESTQSEMIKSFASDGFNLGNNGGVNQSTKTYVAWNWLASNTSASNTDGSISSTVSANTTSGFSIVSWTGNGSNGATIGHGLGVVPKMMIFKILSSADDWTVYHSFLGAGKKLNLNNSDAESTVAEIFNNTEPTSSLITFGTHGRTNTNGANYVGYIFAEKPGYSKFGTYTGNGNTDGTFVYTGFKPAFVMLKNADGSGTWWHMIDNKRNPYNVISKVVFANVNDAEYDLSNYHTDILSNGFKLRTTTGTGMNVSGNKYIYMAFGQSLVGSNNVPCTAR